MGAAQDPEALCSFSWRGVQASLGDPECDEQLRVWAVCSEKVHCDSVHPLQIKLPLKCKARGHVW